MEINHQSIKQGLPTVPQGDQIQKDVIELSQTLQEINLKNNKLEQDLENIKQDTKLTPETKARIENALKAELEDKAQKAKKVNTLLEMKIMQGENLKEESKRVTYKPIKKEID